MCHPVRNNRPKLNCLFSMHAHNCFNSTKLMWTSWLLKSFNTKTAWYKTWCIYTLLHSFISVFEKYVWIYMEGKTQLNDRLYVFCIINMFCLLQKQQILMRQPWHQKSVKMKTSLKIQTACQVSQETVTGESESVTGESESVTSEYESVTV